VLKHIESENIVGHEQAGFRQYKGTEDQTTHLTQVISDTFQAKKVILAVFIDLQKTFDKVWKDNRVSGSTPPCGTLCFKRALRPHCPSTSTLALLLYRYDLVQLYILPLMPYRRSFNRSPSFHTL
jgi:hypothetical protein